MEKAIQALILFSSFMILPEMTRGQLREGHLHEYFLRIRSGESLSVSERKLPGDPRAYISQLEAYLNDSLPAVRAAAAELVYSGSINASDHSDRATAVDLLLRTYRNDDAAHNATRLSYLQGYTRTDFSAFAQNAIRDLVRRQPAYFDRILMLAGFLQLKDLIPDIRPWTQPGIPTSIRWSALISLARMGDATAIAAVLRRAQGLPVNDDVIYHLFPDLVYTRSPTLIAYVVETLHQDRPNCLAADAEREVPIDCGYRIMEQLAPVVKDFPGELDESGDLKTDNYPGTLESIRAWFRMNPDYIILDENW